MTTTTVGHVPYQGMARFWNIFAGATWTVSLVAAATLMLYVPARSWVIPYFGGTFWQLYVDHCIWLWLLTAVSQWMSARSGAGLGERPRKFDLAMTIIGMVGMGFVAFLFFVMTIGYTPDVPQMTRNVLSLFVALGIVDYLVMQLLNRQHFMTGRRVGLAMHYQSAPPGPHGTPPRMETDIPIPDGGYPPDHSPEVVLPSRTGLPKYVTESFVDEYLTFRTILPNGRVYRTPPSNRVVSRLIDGVPHFRELSANESGSQATDANAPGRADPA